MHRETCLLPQVGGLTDTGTRVVGTFSDRESGGVEEGPTFVICDLIPKEADGISGGRGGTEWGGSPQKRWDDDRTPGSCSIQESDGGDGGRSGIPSPGLSTISHKRKDK